MLIAPNKTIAGRISSMAAVSKNVFVVIADVRFHVDKRKASVKRNVLQDNDKSNKKSRKKIVIQDLESSRSSEYLLKRVLSFHYEESDDSNLEESLDDDYEEEAIVTWKVSLTKKYMQNYTWTDMITKPMPFEVVEAEQNLFRNCTSFIKPRYRRKCPFPTRPIRELKISREHPQLNYFRNTFNGMWESSPIIDRTFRPNTLLKAGEFELLDLLFDGPLPLSHAKWKDLQDLKKFCRPEAQQYFDSIKYSNKL
ncbi:hypothetical protein JTB14_015400 [Gonioctena quinquepunctata]|nr:hypothetical protein JTB14_015400 [Gonioctena quinquepunctata]